MTDIWGLCPGCDSWFTCTGWFDRSAPEPTCPTCGVAPTAIENRGTAIRVPSPDLTSAS